MSQTKARKRMAVACENGKMDDVKRAIYDGADDFNWGMVLACEKGCIDIVKLMIDCNKKKSTFYFD